MTGVKLSHLKNREFFFNLNCEQLSGHNSGDYFPVYVKSKIMQKNDYVVFNLIL